MNPLPPRQRFLDSLTAAVRDGTLVKLTLGKARAADKTLKNLFVRPVALKTGPHLSFLYRHETKDITKNFKPDEALPLLTSLLGTDFLDAHLFTPAQTAQLSCAPEGKDKLVVKNATAAPMPPPDGHDRARQHLITPDQPWLRALGVMNERGQPREGMAPKFRQINKFVELLDHLVSDSPLAFASEPFHLVDMACGKGYLTFAAAQHFGTRVRVTGLERRSELVDTCNRIARENALPNLSFSAGEIEDAARDRVDALVALHACDTATDDALFHGIRQNASLLVVSPCCQKEVRPQIEAPEVLRSALSHGIFLERQAEFATDALRALLLEWAGYRTKVFEFISTEHTAKNLMIAASKTTQFHTEKAERNARAFAAFYGIRHQRLAELLEFKLLA